MGMTIDKISEIFKEGGELAGQDADYEVRHEQIKMADAVRQAIIDESHLIAEAGTGVGKSLAYLVPFIFWAVEQDKRVVISTFTKTLQQQLAEKDLPFLEKALGLKFSYALCLGARNYLCLRRLDQAGQHGLFETRSQVSQLENIMEWRMLTKAGIVSELDFEPDDSVWSRVCRESELCMAKLCPHQEYCFYRKAKKREFQSHLLITNHHLFFSNLASGEKILPEYDAVVFDEAHNLEDVATSHLGTDLSNFNVRILLDYLAPQRSRKGMLNRIKNIDPEKKDEIESQVALLRITSDNFFNGILEKFNNGSGTVRFREPHFADDTLSQPFEMLAQNIAELLKFNEDEEEKIEINAAASWAKSVCDEARAITGMMLEDSVYWAEAQKRLRGHNIALHASPIDVSAMIKKFVFDRIKPIVMTSATLSVAGSFSYFKDSVGVDGAQELSVGSPFNYKENTLLYMAPAMPDPNREAKGYAEKVADEVLKIIEITGGRTFVLFTSFKMLNDVYEFVKDKTDIEIMRQGDLPRYKMLEIFKSEKKSGKGQVLFGTNTFWQGVDVPGRALECVVITKLPFAVPDDPVTEAKMQHIENTGRDPFAEYQVPQAVIMLKQGFGRLIRTKNDKGMVAILDPRIKSRFYGKIFLKSLPECRVTTEISEVKDFFADLSHG